MTTGNSQFDTMYELAKTAQSMARRAMEQLKAVQDALGTEERGEALVEVARRAHAAEQKLAALERDLNGMDSAWSDELWRLMTKHFPS